MVLYRHWLIFRARLIFQLGHYWWLMGYYKLGSFLSAYWVEKMKLSEKSRLSFRNDESGRYGGAANSQQSLVKKIRTKFEYDYFFSHLSWCLEGGWHVFATLLLWLHSIYFSSICKCLRCFPSESETVCPFSLLQHWDYCAACASPRNRKGVQLFSNGFRNRFRLFRKAPCWALPKNTAGFCWLSRYWGIQSPIFTVLLMPALDCPCQCYKRFFKWQLRYLLEQNKLSVTQCAEH